MSAANPPAISFEGPYLLEAVDRDWLTTSSKAKQFIDIDQLLCIQCGAGYGCVDICPWKCLEAVPTTSVTDAAGTALPGSDPSDSFMFVIDDEACTRCRLCVDRCPTGAITLGTVTEQPHAKRGSGDSRGGAAYGLRI